MKKLSFFLFLLVLVSNVFAHEHGHGVPTKIWEFVNGNQAIKASFIKKVGGIVFLENENHKVLTFNYANLKKEGQHYISERLQWINTKNSVQNKQSSFLMNTSIWLVFIGIGLLLLAVLSLEKKRSFLVYGFMGLLFVFLGCKNTSSVKGFMMKTNNIAFLESVFSVFDKVNTRYDEAYFYIESDGIPEHEMMTGITNWQQQVPINHDYSGSNAWAIPLHPELAESPLSTKENFMKGAIAIAANGIPIFNPLNNRGEDANAIGELDNWGGHCGRADDYHYHLVPTHLQSKIGVDKPIAYALDGFPVYGETKEELDENLGRFTSDSTYQYHAIKQYPYLIAAMKGKVKLNPSTRAPENEIMPQAKTRGVRPDLRPLRGAKIIDFKNPEPQKYSLTYKVDSLTYIINYGWDANRVYNYEFIKPNGTVANETYTRK